MSRCSRRVGCLCVVSSAGWGEDGRERRLSRSLSLSLRRPPFCSGQQAANTLAARPWAGAQSPYDVAAQSTRRRMQPKMHPSTSISVRCRVLVRPPASTPPLSSPADALGGPRLGSVQRRWDALSPPARAAASIPCLALGRSRHPCSARQYPLPTLVLPGPPHRAG